ncbi:hypothetical protein WN51_14526 [Melipona quadrifasciata]|uniref:Uncharacterized protein n=1 Tax=Melipona quadrifasciata TaxID=166423 RepID=A0A0M8ZY45_9HYME|nr:hypothetical protein WN51_14526 [Melipona quadrifasciata]
MEKQGLEMVKSHKFQQGVNLFVEGDWILVLREMSLYTEKLVVPKNEIIEDRLYLELLLPSSKQSLNIDTPMFDNLGKFHLKLTKAVRSKDVCKTAQLKSITTSLLTVLVAENSNQTPNLHHKHAHARTLIIPPPLPRCGERNHFSRPQRPDLHNNRAMRGSINDSNASLFFSSLILYNFLYSSEEMPSILTTSAREIHECLLLGTLLWGTNKRGAVPLLFGPVVPPPSPAGSRSSGTCRLLMFRLARRAWLGSKLPVHGEVLREDYEADMADLCAWHPVLAGETAHEFEEKKQKKIQDVDRKV